jgi:hypothetical protein
MDTDIWLPLAALLGGWGLAQVTEVLKDQRASNREHQARQSELQRTTFLALQDVLLDLTNLVYKAVMTLPGSPREHPDEKAKKEAARRAWAARRVSGRPPTKPGSSSPEYKTTRSAKRLPRLLLPPTGRGTSTWTRQ